MRRDRKRDGHRSAFIKYDLVAVLTEMEYHMLHRELVGGSDKEPFQAIMSRLQSAVCGLSPEFSTQGLPAAAIGTRSGARASIDQPANWWKIETARRKWYR
jgi:hypothetical protein